MLAKIRILLIAAALLCGSAASAQSFLDALVSGMIEGLAEGLTGSGTSAGQSQGQTNQSQVRTRDNIPPNSMVCTICNGTKRCPCKNGTISFTSSVTGRRLTIQCPNCLGTLQCAGWAGDMFRSTRREARPTVPPAIRLAAAVRPVPTYAACATVRA